MTFVWAKTNIDNDIIWTLMKLQCDLFARNINDAYFQL